MTEEFSRLQLRTLLEQTTVGVLATDAEGWVTTTSKAFRDALGPGVDRLRDTDMVAAYDVRRPDGETPLEPTEKPLARARHGETVRDQILSVDFRDRGRAVMRFNAAPLVDDGRIVGAITTVQDITGEHLVRSDQISLQRRLLVTLNHELRTPLAALLAHTELLGEGEELPADLAGTVEAITRASWRLRDIVATVGDLVELDAETPQSREQVDVDRLAREVVAQAAAGADRTGLPVRPEQPAPQPAEVDPAAVAQGIGALVDCALAADPVGAPEARVGGNDSTVWVNVVDQRSGVGEAGRHDEPSHTGLAMLVARTVAFAHGGELRTEYLNGGGYRSELPLPRSAR